MTAQPRYVSGVPEALPDGETLLWQGKPDWRSLARHALHADKVALYFAVLVGWQVLDSLWDGASPPASVLVTGAVGLVAVGLLAGIAWLMERTTLYAITNRRVIMRIGVALPVTFNLPFATLAAASVKTWRDGTGDIPLQISGRGKIAWLHLWPHARPWRFSQPEPMLRGVPQAAEVAAVLGRAVAAFSASGAPAEAAPGLAMANARRPLPAGRAPRIVTAQG